MTDCGHICTPNDGFRLLENQPVGMVDTDRIREEGLTTEEVLDREFVGPHDTPTEAHWPEYFDDYPEEQPGDEAWLDEDDDGEPVLCWEDGDFSVRLKCIEWGDWEARISIPERVGRHIPKPTGFKAHHPPTIGDHPVGFVDEIEYPDDGYTAGTIVLRLAEAEGMPIVAPSSYVDDLREYAEDSEEYMAEVDEMLAAARENEE